MIHTFFTQLQKLKRGIWCHWCSHTSWKAPYIHPWEVQWKRVEQLGYIKTRRQCLDELQNNLVTSKGCPVTDVMHFFHGDGPEQQFESGEQRGGNNGCSGCSGDLRRYRDLTYCLRSPHLSLADRIKYFGLDQLGERKEMEESGPSKTWLWQSWKLNV